MTTNSNSRLLERRNAECLDDLSSSSDESILPSYSHSASSSSLSSSVSSSWSRDSRKSSFPSFTISAGSLSNESNLHPLCTTLENHMMELRVDSCLNSPESNSCKVYCKNNKNDNNINNSGINHNYNNNNNAVTINNISNIFNRTNFPNYSSAYVETPMVYPAPKKKERKQITDSPNSIQKLQLRGPVNSDNAKNALRERLQQHCSNTTTTTAPVINTNSSIPVPPSTLAEISRASPSSTTSSSFRKFNTTHAMNSLSLAGQSIIDHFSTSPYSSAKSTSADELERIHTDNGSHDKLTSQPPISPRLQKYTSNSPTLFSPSPSSSFISKRSCVAFSPLRPVPPASAATTCSKDDSFDQQPQQQQQNQRDQRQYNHIQFHHHHHQQQQQSLQRNSPLFSATTIISTDYHSKNHHDDDDDDGYSRNRRVGDNYINSTIHEDNIHNNNNHDNNTHHANSSSTIHTSRDRGIFQNRRATSSKSSASATHTNDVNTSCTPDIVAIDTDTEATYLDSSGYTTSSGSSSVLSSSVGSIQSSVNSSTDKSSVYHSSIGSSTGSYSSSFRSTGFRSTNKTNKNSTVNSNHNYSSSNHRSNNSSYRNSYSHDSDTHPIHHS